MDAMDKSRRINPACTRCGGTGTTVFNWQVPGDPPLSVPLMDSCTPCDDWAADNACTVCDGVGCVACRV